MELLKDIANISGKSGLYKILKPTRAGVIVEGLDDKKTKEMVGANARVSVLKDITIFTEDVNHSVALSDLFLKIRETNGETVELDSKNATNNQLFDFLTSVLPDFDRDKVYPSDIRKMISWYNILSKHTPEIFEVPEIEKIEEKEEEVEKV
jgi:Domain of unknown function (DUF5606)